jgi:hypothetical protein
MRTFLLIIINFTSCQIFNNTFLIGDAISVGGMTSESIDPANRGGLEGGGFLLFFLPPLYSSVETSHH